MPELENHHDGLLTIVLADDHAVVREGLKALVNSQPDMCVVGEAADAHAACAAVRELRPHVIILDLSMPGASGVDAASRIHREFPQVKVLALTVHEEQEYVTRLLHSGAAGYVLKRAAASELVRAIRVVAEGGTYIDPSVARHLLAPLADGSASAAGPAETLSAREAQVLARIAQGFSNKEIAADLGLSVKTIETYKSRVVEKLGLRSRVDIVRYAVARGWLTGSGTDTAP